jgi:tRNA (cytidine/uridine-2'-O-)-methyltransferase
MSLETGTLLHVALFDPEIPPNAGNIARLCAANGLALHLVGRLGFRMDDRSLRRAGLDYWPLVDVRRHARLEDLKASLPRSRFFYFSARAETSLFDISYQAGDCLVFGPESRGLPERLLTENPGATLAIPMRCTGVRSLNLATAAGIAVYEALRQLDASASDSTGSRESK